jgi:hypothetical protein
MAPNSTARDDLRSQQYALSLSLNKTTCLRATSHRRYAGTSAKLAPRNLHPPSRSEGRVRSRIIPTSRSLNEHDSLVLVYQDAIFQMPTHCTREHYLLKVTAFVQHILNSIAMGDAHYVLLDDRSFIQAGGYIMAGGSDQLYAACKSLMIGFRTDESRKKRMVNVDHA